MALIIVLAVLGFLLFAYVAAGVRIVKPYQRGIIERLGKYKETVDPGLRLIIPLVDTMRVVDMRERPIEDAVVTVESGPNRPDIAAGTGADGAFMLNNLTLGRYLLRADAEGFAPGFTEVQVLPQRPARVVRIRLVQQSSVADDDIFDEVSDEIGPE